MATIAIAIAIFLSAIANILVGTMSKILYYLIKFDSCTPLSSDTFLTFFHSKIYPKPDNLTHYYPGISKSCKQVHANFQVNKNPFFLIIIFTSDLIAI